MTEAELDQRLASLQEKVELLAQLLAKQQQLIEKLMKKL